MRVGRLTNVRHDASHDDLFLARGLHSSLKLCVVPGIDFALSHDEGSIRVPRGQERHQRIAMRDALALVSLTCQGWPSAEVHWGLAEQTSS